jgi:hypothetical protein
VTVALSQIFANYPPAAIAFTACPNPLEPSYPAIRAPNPASALANMYNMSINSPMTIKRGVPQSLIHPLIVPTQWVLLWSHRPPSSCFYPWSSERVRHSCRARAGTGCRRGRKTLCRGHVCWSWARYMNWRKVVCYPEGGVHKVV